MSKLSKTQNRLRHIVEIIYQRSGDPTHPDNAADADWQSGYFFGCHTSNISDIDIHDEWIARDKPGKSLHTDTVIHWMTTDEVMNEHEKKELKKFRAWKAGYAAGRFTRLA